jgi:hypothetical protein
MELAAVKAMEEAAMNARLGLAPKVKEKKTLNHLDDAEMKELLKRGEETTLRT